jgi:hypothetical protein
VYAEAGWEEDRAGNRDFEIGEIDTNRKHFDELAQGLDLGSVTLREMPQDVAFLVPQTALYRHFAEH